MKPDSHRRIWLFSQELLDGSGNLDIIADMALPIKNADKDYDPIIEKLKRVVCYVCKGVFWMDDKYNPNAIRYTKKPGRLMKNAVCCPYCGSHLLPNALARSERESKIV